jgi:uncharacterized protein YndB with AHSA1/START domain
MSDDTHGEIIVDELGTATYRLVRILPHPVARVWRRLTDRKHLHEWLTSEPGGFIRLHLEGEVYLPTIGGAVIRSEVLDVVPEQLLSIAWETTEWVGGIVEWIMAPTDGSDTALILQHTEVPLGLDHAVRTMANWRMSLDMLAASLAGTPVAWNWDAWQAFVVHYESVLATQSGEFL